MSATAPTPACPPATPSPSTACLGVVVPVFNEERTVAELLRRVLARPEVAEVVAVDDGSTDGSGRELDEIAVEDSRVGSCAMTGTGAKEPPSEPDCPGSPRPTPSSRMRTWNMIRPTSRW